MLNFKPIVLFGSLTFGGSAMAQLSTEVFLSKRIPLDDFEEDFYRRFPNGIIELVVEDVPGHPGSRFINILIPL